VEVAKGLADAEVAPLLVKAEELLFPKGDGAGVPDADAEGAKADLKADVEDPMAPKGFTGATG
jgi:hypothetical protein